MGSIICVGLLQGGVEFIMLRRLFEGRYGWDRLNLVLVVVSLIVIDKRYVWILGLALIGYAMFRALSLNTEKRYQELQRFDFILTKIKLQLAPFALKLMKWVNVLFGKINLHYERFQQRKYYVFTKCSNCKNTLRVPKNKGKLSVTCPVCKVVFIKKT